MKQTIKLLKFCLLIIILVCSINIYAQQENKNQEDKSSTKQDDKSNVKAKNCSSNDVKFTCPEGFNPAQMDSDTGLVFLRHKQYKLGVYVIAPKVPFDEKKLINDLAVKTTKFLMPDEKQKYEWRELGFKTLSSEDKITKHEVSGRMLQGNNGESLVLFQYRHVVFQKKDIYVGYIFEGKHGEEEVKAYVNRDYVSDSMAGCNYQAEIIYSVTGEEIDRFKEWPCVIRVQGVSAPTTAKPKP